MIDLTEYAVKKGQDLGAEDVIAQGVNSRNQQVRFSTNKIDIAKTWHERSIKVFLVLNKKVVGTEIRDFQTLDTSLETIVKLAKVSRENPSYAGIAEGPFHYRSIQSDPQLKNLTNVSDFVITAMNKALENAETTAGILYLTNENIFLSSSHGINTQDEITNIELSIRAFSQKEASGHSVTCSPTLKEFDPEKAGEEAGEFARLARDPVNGEEGVYDVIFSPLFFGSVLSNSIRMTSAFEVFSGTSMYGGKIGEKVASPHVTVTDTPFGLKKRLFDDEGVPTRETFIIENGILKTYLHNTSTAAQVKVETTGNAGWIIPEARNVHVKPGDMRGEELFREVDHGLYLTNTWYTRFQNFVTGDFSTIPRDAVLKIEKGEITGSLKNIRVSDNLLRVYNSIEGVSREQKLVHWWAEVPTPCISSHVLARNVRVTVSAE